MSNASPEAALNKLLETATDVTALRSTRMFPGIAPKGTTFPFQTYTRIVRTHHHDILTHTGLAQADVQIDSWSDNKIEVDDMAEKTRVFLEVQSGTVAVEGKNIVIDHIKMDDQQATSEPADDGSDRVIQRVRQEYTVEHDVTIPTGIPPSPPIIATISDDSVVDGDPYTGPTPTLTQGTTPVTWTLITGPALMTINSSTGVVSWPTSVISGSPHTITIRATNSEGFDNETWELTVTATPEAPIIDAISDDSVVEATTYTGPTPSLAQGTAPITWTLIVAPALMTINSSSGVVGWPTAVLSGSPHTITIRATNSEGSDDESWALTVTAAGGFDKSDLIAWYDMEADGDDSHDAGPYNLTANGAIVHATGHIGDAADFEANNVEYYSYPDGTPFDITDAFTIGAWVKLESLGATTRVLIGKEGGGNNRSYGLNQFAATAWRLFIWDASDTQIFISSTTAPSTTEFQFVVGTFEPSTALRIWVNGVNETSDTSSIPATLKNSTIAFRIGQGLGPGAVAGSNIDGLVDSPFVANRVYSGAEILSLYNSGAGTNYAGLASL